MVVGDRQVGQIEHFSGSKKALQRLGSWVVRRLSGTEIADTTSGFRAYNREAALGLLVVDNFTYTLESLIQAGKMLVAVDQVAVETNPQTRESRLFDSTGAYVRRNALSILRIYARYEPLRVFASAGLVVALLALAAWMPFLLDWIFNGDSTGHVQSLILGAVLFIAAIQLLALGVIGDLLAGQRVMTQRVFERVRRVELALGVEPSHYEPGARALMQRCASAGRPAAPERRLGDRRLRQDGELPRDRRRPHRRDHLRLLLHRLARALQARLRADHGALVGRLHHDLDPLPAGRTAALPPHLRTPGQGRADRRADAGRGDDPARPGGALRGRSRWPCAGRSQDGLLEGNETLYWVFFSAVLFYAASYFARGFLAGQQPLRPLHRADPLRVGLPHPLRGAGRGRPAQRPVVGRDRDRRRPLALA